MKKILVILLLILSCFSGIYTAEAVKLNVITKEEQQRLDREVTIEEAFNLFGKQFEGKLLDTYEYIELKFKNIEEGSQLEKSMKTLVYLDKIENAEVDLDWNEKITLYRFYKISSKIFDEDFIWRQDIETLKAKNTTVWHLENLEEALWRTTPTDLEISDWWDEEIARKKKIFTDVYTTLTEEHYDNETIEESKMLDWAISWLAEWTWDKHTVYFPPIESKNFSDSLKWSYEWIWAYVDMVKPWEFKILSPIKWSPSEKAWLKWWDIVIKVDWKEITEKNSSSEIVSWIKGPEWTKVILTVERDWKILEIEITRWKIVLTDVDYKLINSKIFYIEIKNFWENVSKEFNTALEELNKEKRVKRVILDLRNNGWGYLNEVVAMLSNFVEEWKPIAVIKYQTDSTTYTSYGYDIVDFSNYELIILQNSWTASASEILIWTLKDYYPELVIIWEKSYWKGSVQTLRTYTDGSVLKYTVAKWFTWLTETWIDWIWIEPTIELEFDLEKYQEKEIDNQLQKAINYRKK